MNAMLVGADQLGNIPKTLSEFGITVSRHVSGRESAHQKKAVALPSGIELLILFTDFLGHNVMRSFREAALRNGVRIVCCRRSVCSVKQSLELCGLACGRSVSCAGTAVRFAAQGGHAQLRGPKRSVGAGESSAG